jgi:aryl-alcohol dehydrogenase-like predicted oxidoreductase
VISRLALGTAQFGMAYGPSGRQIPLEECRAIISTARASGIDTIDTATAYGNAQQRLDEIGVADFRVVTKIMGDEPIDGHYYGVLMHRPSAELYDRLYRLKASGIAKKIGISVYTTAELEDLVPRFQFDLVQAPFNLGLMELATSGWLKRLKDLGIEVHTRSVFGRGELLPSHTVAECLALPLSHPEIDRIIVGVDSAAQLQEIVDCAQSL